MYINNKLIFLAGATGTVGSNIAEYILDNYPTARIRGTYRQTKPFIKHERMEFVKGDLRKQEDCRRMVKGCDAVIMAASQSASSENFTAYPWKFLNDNIIMNAQMLEAFYLENIKRIVYIGTSAVYQEFQGHIKENELDMNKESHHTYLGVTWIARFVEKLCQFWHEKTGMEIIIVRAANIFGPNAREGVTEYFVPAIIRKAIRKMDPFEVWGSGDVTRDIIYSQDFARAIAMMLDNLKIKFDVFNIGSGIKTTVDDVVKLALNHARHKPSKINYDISKPTTIKFRALDVSKAKIMLGWQPEFSISEGIKKTVDWMTENEEKQNK